MRKISFSGGVFWTKSGITSEESSENDRNDEIVLQKVVC